MVGRSSWWGQAEEGEGRPGAVARDNSTGTGALATSGERATHYALFARFSLPPKRFTKIRERYTIFLHEILKTNHVERL